MLLQKTSVVLLGEIEDKLGAGALQNVSTMDILSMEKAVACTFDGGRFCQTSRRHARIVFDQFWDHCVCLVEMHRRGWLQVLLLGGLQTRTSQPESAHQTDMHHPDYKRRMTLKMRFMCPGGLLATPSSPVCLSAHASWVARPQVSISRKDV